MNAVPISKNEYNYLKDDGSYLLDEHVKFCWNFSEGFGIVYYNDNTFNYVNSEGITLLKNNIKECSYFGNEFANVKINDCWYSIDKEFNFYSEYRISFKKLYNEYPHKRSELIEIISKYTYFDVEEYFI